MDELGTSAIRGLIQGLERANQKDYMGGEVSQGSSR